MGLKWLLGVLYDIVFSHNLERGRGLVSALTPLSSLQRAKLDSLTSSSLRYFYIKREHIGAST